MPWIVLQGERRRGHKFEPKIFLLAEFVSQLLAVEGFQRLGVQLRKGYAVAEEEAYPQVAERLLGERGRRDVEVVNGGIPDYNSRQERQLLAQLLLCQYCPPDAVFLG